MPLPIVHHPAYVADLPDGHRFPMQKFGKLAQVLRRDDIVTAGGFIAPIEAPRNWLTLAHDPAYVDAVLTQTVERRVAREIGFPIEETVARRARCATSGTVLTARLALEAGIACNTAGGSHHARRAQGAGFCVFNDVAVAACVMREEGLTGTILVIDCDVHQGDGTADIFKDDASVFTFSIHAEKNYPVRKVAGDRDIGVADGLDDVAYRDILSIHVPGLLESLQPVLVFYNAGVDPHAEDRLGRLSLSDEGLAERDRMVIGEARRRGVSVACVIGGGYSTDIDTLAMRHSIIHRVASEFV